MRDSTFVSSVAELPCEKRTSDVKPASPRIDVKEASSWIHLGSSLVGSTIPTWSSSPAALALPYVAGSRFEQPASEAAIVRASAVEMIFFFITSFSFGKEFCNPFDCFVEMRLSVKRFRLNRISYQNCWKFTSDSHIGNFYIKFSTGFVRNLKISVDYSTIRGLYRAAAKNFVAIVQHTSLPRSYRA